MNVANFSQIFPKNPFQMNSLFSKNRTHMGQAKSPANTLQQISNRMIAKQEGSEKAADLVKTQELRMDTYTKTDSSVSLDKAKDEVLQLYLQMTKMYATTSGNREKELLSFKEHLQEIDQTIQNYQDVLDGKTALQQGQSVEGITQLMKRVKQYREQFLADGIEKFNRNTSVYGNKTFDRYAKRVFGENPFAGKAPSDWKINSSASDIYTEIDRVVEETHSFNAKMKQGVSQLSGLLKDRGYGDTYSPNWEAERTEYRSSFDKDVDARKLEIERLRYASLQNIAENL